MDGGKSWQPIPIQLPLVSSVRSTALALDPLDSQKLFVALAAASPSGPVPTTSLGVYSSSDGGSTFIFAGFAARLYHDTVGARPFLIWLPIRGDWHRNMALCVGRPFCRLSPELAQIHPFGTYSVDIPEGITTFFILERARKPKERRSATLAKGSRSSK